MTAPSHPALPGQVPARSQPLFLAVSNLLRQAGVDWEGGGEEKLADPEDRDDVYCLAPCGSVTRK